MNLFFTKRDAGQLTLLDNTIKVNQRYFEAVRRHAMPLDMRAFKALQNDPMAVDIYTWLAYRLPQIIATVRPCQIPVLAISSLSTEFASKDQCSKLPPRYA